eukprot:3583977-Rhodomonas_salina.1
MPLVDALARSLSLLPALVEPELELHAALALWIKFAARSGAPALFATDPTPPLPLALAPDFKPTVPRIRGSGIMAADMLLCPLSPLSELKVPADGP